MNPAPEFQTADETAGVAGRTNGGSLLICSQNAVEALRALLHNIATRYYILCIKTFAKHNRKVNAVMRNIAVVSIAVSRPDTISIRPTTIVRFLEDSSLFGTHLGGVAGGSSLTSTLSADSSDCRDAFLAGSSSSTGGGSFLSAPSSPGFDSSHSSSF